MTQLAEKQVSLDAVRDSASAAGVSRCKGLDRSEVLYLDPARHADFRRWFAPVFACWLRENFATPEGVAAAFGVRNSTAWNWWNGDNRASGDAVARLFMAMPHAAVWFREKWAAQ